MPSDLTVPDAVVMGFFTAVVIGLSSAVVMLWKYITDPHKKKRPPRK